MSIIYAFQSMSCDNRYSITMRYAFFTVLLLIRVYSYYSCSMEEYEKYLNDYSMKCDNDCDVYKK